MNLSICRERIKAILCVLGIVALVASVAACGNGSLPGENPAGAVATATPTTQPENLTPPTSAQPPSDNPTELLQKCKDMLFSASDADKEAAGVKPARCLWAQQEVAKLAQSDGATSTTAAPSTTSTSAAPSTTEAPSSTTSTLAPSTTTTKPPDMSDTVALALMAQQMADQNGLHLGVGVTCDFNCVLLNGLQGQSDKDKAWSLLMKAVLSPVFLDDAARTVQGDTYTDTRPIGDPMKAADDLNIVMTFVSQAQLKTGVTPAGTTVYNTVVQDGQVVQFTYITTKDREWVQFEKDGRYIRFFTTCGNRNSEAPPGTPITPNPPCHDDTPVPCTPPPPTTVCEQNCGSTTTVCTVNCNTTTTKKGKNDDESVTHNPSVPSTYQYGSTTVPPVGPPVPPVTTPTGCDAAHPCPTNAPPTSNPATTLPQSCSQEPNKPGCTPAPPPPSAPPSSVTTTTHVTMPPPPPS